MGSRLVACLRPRASPKSDSQRAGAATDGRLERLVEDARIEDRASISRRVEEILAEGDIRVVMGRDFHQPACHIHCVTRRRNVMVAVPAKARGHDQSVMRSDLEAELGGNRSW